MKDVEPYLIEESKVVQPGENLAKIITFSCTPSKDIFSQVAGKNIAVYDYN